MLQLADTSIAGAAEEATDLSRGLVVVDMKPSRPAAGFCLAADGALTILLGKHLCVGAMGDAESTLELGVGLFVWITSIPLAIVCAMFLGIVPVSGHDSLLLALFAPVLCAISGALMWIKFGEWFSLAAMFTKLHDLPSYQEGWFSMNAVLNQPEA